MKPPKKKRPDYSDETRAKVVAMLNAEGYPETKGALTKVADAFGIPARTISRWFNGEANPVLDRDVSEKEFELASLLRKELEAIIPLLEKKRGEASYSQLVTATGILTDKMLLLDGKNTARESITIHIVED